MEVKVEVEGKGGGTHPGENLLTLCRHCITWSRWVRENGEGEVEGGGGGTHLREK